MLYNRLNETLFRNAKLKYLNEVLNIIYIDRSKQESNFELLYSIDIYKGINKGINKQKMKD